MKALTFTLMMLVSVFSMAEDSSINQDGSVTNNGAMNLYGVNNGRNTTDLAYDSYGGGIRCASPALSFDVDQSYLPDSQKITTLGTGISIPLGAAFDFNSCEKAANLQNQLNFEELTERRNENIRREEIFQVRAEKEWLEKAILEAQFAKVCLELHKDMSASTHTELWNQCEKYSPITKDHHGGHAPINAALIPDGHGRISPNRQDRE